MPHAVHEKMTLRSFWSSLKRVGTQWRFYLFSALFAVSATSFEKTGVYSEFLLWLRSTGYYPAAQVNYYSSIFTAVSRELSCGACSRVVGASSKCSSLSRSRYCRLSSSPSCQTLFRIVSSSIRLCLSR